MNIILIQTNPLYLFLSSVGFTVLSQVLGLYTFERHDCEWRIGKDVEKFGRGIF